MDHKLLELLYCPLTQTKLEYDREQQVLISKAANLVFLIKDDIPIMLESEAIALDTWEKDHKSSSPFSKPEASTSQEVENTLAPEEEKAQDTENKNDIKNA